MSQIHTILPLFEPIALGEMDKVSFLNRTDTKFLFHIDQLPLIFKNAIDNYKVLTIYNIRLFQYKTLYFDTKDNNLYLHHHNGNRPRYKVRIREYLDTSQTYLEIKRKTNLERTMKTRVQLKYSESEMSDQSIQYIKKHLPSQADSLHPALWTDFSRITLVNNELSERITTDIYLKFEANNKIVEMPFLVISEVKRDRHAGSSVYIRLLKQSNISPSNVSKYAIGTVLLQPASKYNRFKEKLLILKKIENGA